MIRIVHAELMRLARRRTVLVGSAVAVAFAAVAAFTVFSSATDGSVESRRSGATLASLSGTGGGTEAFAVAASFAGFLVFVSFIAVVATEFSGGTLRSLLLRDPHRVRVLAGKIAGLLVVAAAMVLLVEATTFALSVLAAPANDVPTDAWFSLASLGAAVRDYGTVLAGVTGWAIFGSTLAVVFRSAPIALAVGFAWAGPFENIVVDSWSTGYRVFPGQVLASLIRGGTVELGMARASVTAVAYAAVASSIALVLVSRRDVTA
jgi:ABC-type transport system involved in multi-copper enzyme maturation permease subunit